MNINDQCTNQYCCALNFMIHITCICTHIHRVKDLHYLIRKVFSSYPYISFKIATIDMKNYRNKWSFVKRKKTYRSVSVETWMFVPWGRHIVAVTLDFYQRACLFLHFTIIKVRWTCPTPGPPQIVATLSSPITHVDPCPSPGGEEQAQYPAAVLDAPWRSTVTCQYALSPALHPSPPKILSLPTCRQLGGPLLHGSLSTLGKVL